MRVGTLGLLIVITAGAVAAATYVAVSRQAEQTTAAVEAGPAFPGLLDRVNDVTRILVRAVGTTITVARGADGTWSVTEKGNYPADLGDVKETVVGLATLQLIEPRTAKPELYQKVGVADIETAGSTAVRLTLLDAEGKPLADLLKGKTERSGAAAAGTANTLFVRRVGEAQSWLAKGTLSAGAAAADWLKADLPKLDRDRIAKVVIRHPGGDVVTAARPASTQQDFTLENVPAGKKAKKFEVNGIAGVAEYMSFQDVIPAAGLDFSGAIVTDLAAFDGLVLSARSIRKDDKAWVQFAASVDPARVPPAAPPATAEPAPAPAPVPTADPAAATPAAASPATDKPATDSPQQRVEREAKEINDRFGAWAYQLNDYTAKTLTKTLAELVEAEDTN